MATGDAAAAAGMAVVGGTDDRRNGYVEINKTRDYIAPLKNDLAEATPAATGDRLVRRSPLGKIAGVEPTEPQHLATKGYIDTKIANLDLGTVAATPDTIARRGEGGRVSVGTPVNIANATTKGYVDGEIDEVRGDVLPLISNVRAGEMSSTVYNRDLSGTRRSVWMGSPSSGMTELGWASSLSTKKQSFQDPGFTLEQLRAIPVVLYKYRKAVAAEKRGEIDHAPTEIGTLADKLHNIGLWQFVIYEGHGDDAKPQGVHYELLGLAAISLGQKLADRIDAIEERLARLEGGEQA